jgi:polar amino acid transport system substrate-binding protein
MGKKIAVISIAIWMVLGNNLPSFAEGVLERINQTGVIKAGYRKDTIPFGSLDQQGKPVGYSLDILELIRSQTEQKLGKKINLELTEITPDNRFEKIINGTIDIECGSTTVTWEREKNVDFSVSYFGGGTQLIVKQDSKFANASSLSGAKIAVMPNTTNEMAMKTFVKEATLILVRNEKEGWQKLQQGEVDAFAGDGILLQGLRLKANNPELYEIVPEFPYLVESYACTLPQNQSQWRDLVNYSIVKFMQGVVVDTPSAVDIYERWFGVNGATPYPRETMVNYFQGITNGYEWIPLDERY